MARFDDINGGLHPGAAPECPSCGADDWKPDPQFVLLQQVELENLTPTGRGAAVRAYECNQCAYMRLHGVTLRYA